MMASELDPGDVLVWPETPKDRFRVAGVSTLNRYTEVLCDRSDGTSVKFHYPWHNHFPGPEKGGPEVYPSEGGTCEACSTFLHDDDPGIADPVSGALFCSACQEII